MVNFDYGYQPLLGIPDRMAPWNMSMDLTPATEFGEYVLVGCEPADIESHHQVVVMDEDGQPLSGVGVIFGYNTGPWVAPRPRINHWYMAPRVLTGNYQKTDPAGCAKHTFGEGGETIWIWDVDRDGVLRLSSDVVFNCSWLQERFNHTGVKLTFQRRQQGVMPLRQRLAEIERRLAELEAR
jgi:hypothetical protein